MNKTKRELFLNYIKGNVAPILVDFIDGSIIPGSVVLPADCEITKLNGYYNNKEFMPPKWLGKILNSKMVSVLVIDRIDSISKDEQIKFVEILKYRQVSTFKLPENTIIVVTAKEISKKTINEEIYSLMVHIKE